MRAPQSPRSTSCTLAALAASCLAGSAPCFAANELWQPVGPETANVLSYVQHPTDPRSLLLGTLLGGLYRSSDAGLTWKHLGTPFADDAVFALAADVLAPGTFYAGTFQNGVFGSSDGGDTWQPLNSGLQTLNIAGLALDPSNPARLLACTFEGVYTSADAGGHWQAPSGNGLVPAICARFSSSAPGTAYVGTDGQGVRRSTDGGTTWENWSAVIESATVYRLSEDPADPATLYAATNVGIWLRAEGDASWTSLNFDLPPESIVLDVQVHPGDGRVFAATSNGVFTLASRTATSWTRWYDHNSRFVIINPVANLIHVAGAAAWFVATADDGWTFTPSDRGIQNTFPDALAIVNFSGNSVIYAGTERGVFYSSELFRTGGGPLPWVPSTNLADQLVLELTPHPARTQTLFAGTERAGVWRSDDHGASWVQRSTGIVPTKVNAITQSPVGNQTMYLGTSSGLFVSRDQGQTWAFGTKVAAPPDVSTVETDAVRPGIAHFGTLTGAIYMSIDDGQSFTFAKSFPGDAIKQIRSARFHETYAVTYGGRLYSSPQVGDDWGPKDQTIGHRVLCVEVDQTHPWIGYAGTDSGGVYKTASDGTEWTQVNEGITDPHVFAIAVDPGAPETIYAGAVGAVFRTTNGGAHWDPLGSGLPPRPVTSLVVDATSPNRLFAAVMGEGIYRSDDGGAVWTCADSSDAFRRGPFPITQASASLGIYAGSDRLGLFKLGADGQRWDGVSQGLTELVRGIEISRSNPDRVYAGTLSSGVFTSVDGGESWTYVGLHERLILQLALHPQDDQTLYAATLTGLLCSRNGGATWTESLAGWPITAIRVSPTAPDHVYAATAGFGVVRSVDGGATWQTASAGLGANLHLLAVQVDPGDSRTVYAGTTGDGVYVSEDGGDSWRPLGQGNSHSRVIALAIDPADPTKIYSGNEGGGVYFLRRGGGVLSWATLAGPASDTLLTGAPSDTLRARVWFAGLTEGPGADPGVAAQLGYGPRASDPASSPDWIWADAAFRRDSGVEDEYGSTVTILSAGTYDYSFRFACCDGPWQYADGDGTSNGYASEQAGTLVVTGTTEVSGRGAPRVLALRAIANPMRGGGRLELDLPRDAETELVIFDLQGRRARTLVRGPLRAGVHTLAWDGRDALGELEEPGVYLARVKVAGHESRRIKLVVLR